jgi:protein O-mannosyl-transferase
MRYKTPEIKRSSDALIIVFLTISILVVYWQVRTFEFISFDDYLYVRDNPHIIQGLSLTNIKWAITSLYAANWHPLTWLSHMTDGELFGLKPGMHHFTNVFFHIANTLLLFYFLRRMTDDVWKSAIVAALFALHPLHVESVAWVSERKDVLSTFFWMLTMISYSWYVKHRTAGRYLAVAACYALGLMSKPMLVTLPVVLLLLDFWPLKRTELIKTEEENASARRYMPASGIRWSGILPLILEKGPLFLLAGAASILTILAQKGSGAISTLDMVPLYIRFENASISYITYLGKTIWPFHLAIFYPYPKMFNILLVVGSLLLLVLVTLLVLMLIRRLPFLIVGWFWFLVTLVPVIGIAQVGSQAMADRYTYIPLIGIFIIVAWGLPEFLDKWRSGRHILAGIFCAIVPILMWVTWLQIGYWKNNVTLFSHAIKVTSDNYLAHDSLGAALFDKGEIDAAIYQYTEALKIKPKYMNAQNNLGAALAKQGKYMEAINHYRESLLINPDFASAHYNLGIALAGVGKTDEAVKEYKAAIQIDPQYVSAYNNLGLAFADKGNVNEAVIHYKIALQIKPDFVKARLNMVSLLVKQRKFDDAILELNNGLLIEPESYILYSQLARLYDMKGEKDLAIAEYKKILSIQPNSTLALNNLAILYSSEKRYDLALSSLQKLIKIKPNNPEVYYNIACIYSKQGRLEESVHYLEQAIGAGFNDKKLLRTDPDLENIRGTESYMKLVKDNMQ